MNKKIGILTFHNADNYGAFLQAYALQKILIDKGFDAYIINYRSEFFEESYTFNPLKKKSFRGKAIMSYRWLLHFIRTSQEFLRKKRFEKSRKNFFNYTRKYRKTELNEISNTFDYIIVGSDQVWNMSVCGNDTTYLLDFVNTPTKKIAYAPSIGKNNISISEVKLFKNNLIDFYSISSREKTGTSFIENKLGLKCTTVLDPTLLLSEKEWIPMLNDNSVKKPYIFVMTIIKPTNLVDNVFELAKTKNLDVISFSDLKTKYSYKRILTGTVQDYLYYIKNARYVFTTSFHTLAFSINFKKDVYYELSKENNNKNSRLNDLCVELNITDREIKSSKFVEQNRLDYEHIAQKLAFLKEKSLAFLNDSLSCEKENDSE